MEGIWLTANIKNLYANPSMRSPSNYRITFQNSGLLKRKLVNMNNLSWVQNEYDTIYSNFDSNSFRYAVLDNDKHLKLYTSGNVVAINKEMISGASILLCVQVSNGQHRAVSVRPLCIDNILLDYPDFNKYDFEILYFNKHKQTLVDIKTFADTSDFEHTFFDVSKTKMRMNSSEWLKSLGNTSGALNFNATSWDTIRFRLRDKNTHKVGELSYSGIVTEKGSKLAFRQMLVKSML